MQVKRSSSVSLSRFISNGRQSLLIQSATPIESAETEHSDLQLNDTKLQSFACFISLTAQKSKQKPRAHALQKINVKVLEMYGAVSRARTSDFMIFSHALSQLSYHGE